jgi:hypothetical protein
MLNNLDFSPGYIFKPVEDDFDFSKEIISQDKFSLKENFFTVVYKVSDNFENSLWLGIDWLPGLSKKKGRFCILICISYEDEVYDYHETRDIQEMVETVMDFHEKAKIIFQRLIHGDNEVRKEAKTLEHFKNLYSKNRT